jgi:hypothetical protein
VVEVVAAASSSAVLHAPSRYSNAVLARGKIDESELQEEAGSWFNQLKRKENALGLSLRSFVGPKIG